MIKLYGFPVSNYYNMVKFALLEKGADFEEVAVMPNQESDFLAKSPMGKVPCIETNDGFISETLAILEYLEETLDGPSLLPKSAKDRARCRELMLANKLYIELAARRHFPHLFFGEDRNESAVAEVKPVLENGARAIAQMSKFSPYAMGSEFTLADIVSYHSFGYASNVAEAIYGMDLVAAVPGLKESREAVAARKHCQAVDSVWQAALAEFQANS